MIVFQAAFTGANNTNLSAYTPEIGSISASTTCKLQTDGAISGATDSGGDGNFDTQVYDNTITKVTGTFKWRPELIASRLEIWCRYDGTHSIGAFIAKTSVSILKDGGQVDTSPNTSLVDNATYTFEFYADDTTRYLKINGVTVKTNNTAGTYTPVGAGQKVKIRFVNNYGSSSAAFLLDDVTVDDGTSGDTTPPTLTVPTAVVTGNTTATVGATTDDPTGTLFEVVTQTATQPTKAQVEAGLNNLGTAAVHAGSITVTSTGAKTINTTGLANATGYYSHLMHKDPAGNQSAVVTTALFTTDNSVTFTLAAANVPVIHPQSSTLVLNSFLPIKCYGKRVAVNGNNFSANGNVRVVVDPAGGATIGAAKTDIAVTSGQTGSIQVYTSGADANHLIWVNYQSLAAKPTTITVTTDGNHTPTCDSSEFATPVPVDSSSVAYVNDFGSADRSGGFATLNNGALKWHVNVTGTPGDVLVCAYSANVLRYAFAGVDGRVTGDGSDVAAVAVGEAGGVGQLEMIRVASGLAVGGHDVDLYGSDGGGQLTIYAIEVRGGSVTTTALSDCRKVEHYIDSNQLVYGATPGPNFVTLMAHYMRGVPFVNGVGGSCVINYPAGGGGCASGGQLTSRVNATHIDTDDFFADLGTNDANEACGTYVGATWQAADLDMLQKLLAHLTAGDGRIWRMESTSRIDATNEARIRDMFTRTKANIVSIGSTKIRSIRMNPTTSGMLLSLADLNTDQLHELASGHLKKANQAFAMMVPNLSAPSLVATGQNTATVGVTTDTPSPGTIFSVTAPETANPPSGPQIAAGTDGDGNPGVVATSTAFAAGFVDLGAIGGLAPANVYTTYIVQRLSAPDNRYSAIIYGSFETDPGPSDPNAPSATLVSHPNVTAAGGTQYDFTVRFDDDVAVDVSTIQSASVFVSRPGGAGDLTCVLVGVDVGTDGTPRVATFRATPPGGVWDASDNGTYHIWTDDPPNAAADTSANPVPTNDIGTFTVSIATPSLTAATIAFDYATSTGIRIIRTVAPSGGTAPLTTNLYRSTVSGFIPSGTPLASNVTFPYLDSTGLVHGVLYHYKAVTVDSATTPLSATSNQVSEGLPYDGTGGGSPGVGTGENPIDHSGGNVGVLVDGQPSSTDCLQYLRPEGSGVAGLNVAAYLASEYNATPPLRIPKGVTTTGLDGRWISPLMLESGTYILIADSFGDDFDPQVSVLEIP